MGDAAHIHGLASEFASVLPYFVVFALGLVASCFCLIYVCLRKLCAVCARAWSRRRARRDHNMLCAAVLKLPTRKVECADQNGDCAICLEPFAAGDSVQHLACLHEFHAGCISKWLLLSSAAAGPGFHLDVSSSSNLSRRRNPSCPLCKATLIPNE